MDDTELSQLSVRELEDLRSRIHVAIRARIRAQQEAMAARQRRPTGEAAPRAAQIDLARERDTWLAKKKAGSSAL